MSKSFVSVEEMADWLNRAVAAGHGKAPLVVSEAGGITGCYTDIRDLLYDADEPLTAHRVDEGGEAEEAKTIVLVIETQDVVGWNDRPGLKRGYSRNI